MRFYLLGILVVGIIACGESAPEGTATPVTIEVVDNVTNIVNLYTENEVAAESTYTDKWADITGQVTEIEKKGGKIEVNLSGIGDMFPLSVVVCKISEEDSGDVAQLRADNIVTIRGKIEGVPGVSNVVVEPCKLLP